MSIRGRPRRFDRQQALGKAMEVFWAKGFENASLADLTAAMGVNAPSLYAAFGDKETLFWKAVELYATTSGSGIWEPIEAAPTAREAVEGLLRRSAEAFTRGASSKGCLIVLAAPQNTGAHPSICDGLRDLRLSNIDLLERRLQRAVVDGELPAKADCRAFANYVVTLQHGMSIQARDGASCEMLHAIVDQAMAAWSRFASPDIAR